MLALAGVVVLVLGFPAEGSSPPLVAGLFPVGLHLAFLVSPVLAALLAAGSRWPRMVLPLLFAPVGQLVVAAALVFLR